MSDLYLVQVKKKKKRPKKRGWPLGRETMVVLVWCGVMLFFALLFTGAI